MSDAQDEKLAKGRHCTPTPTALRLRLRLLG